MIGPMRRMRRGRIPDVPPLLMKAAIAFVFFVLIPAYIVFMVGMIFNWWPL